MTLIVLNIDVNCIKHQLTLIVLNIDVRAYSETSHSEHPWLVNTPL